MTVLVTLDRMGATTAPDGDETARIVEEFVDGLTVRASGDPDVFLGATPDWHGDPMFGGTILGQAMSAACGTVDLTDRLPHSLHGSFLRPVRTTTTPPELRVERVRDGRMFSTRRVGTWQDGKLCFEALVSFHVGGELPAYQVGLDAGLPRPAALETTVPEWGIGPYEHRDIGPAEPDAEGYRTSTVRSWSRLWHPPRGDAATIAAVLAYGTDMSRSSGRPWRLDGDVTGMVSIDHAVWIHRLVPLDEWLLYDFHCLASAGGRTLIRGTLHTESGDLAVSMAQEMVILQP